MLKLAVTLTALASPVAAQFGARNSRAGAGGNDVDLAMAGWEQLSQNPDKMQEVMASLKDPEVMAKAQEMLKDPTYMAAARAKVEELQAKAQSRGLLDANGQPAAGAAAAAAAMGLGGGAAPQAADPREYELENMARHRTGELNDAELGMANLKQAMGDPGLMKGIAEMMKDPNTMAEVQKMMSDPAFQAQAQRVAADLKGSGGLDFSKMAEMMGGAGGAGGMGGMGGMGGGGAGSEIERLRRENAMLKSRVRDEL